MKQATAKQKKPTVKQKLLRQNGKSGSKIKKHVLTRSLEFYPKIFRNI